MIHAWFEQIAWLEYGLPSPEALRRVAAGFQGSGLNIDAAVSSHVAVARNRWCIEQRGTFLPEDLRQNFQSSPRLEVHNERRFAVRDDQRMLSGTIDRLVLIYDGDEVVAGDVIDFKTDAVSLDDATHIRKAFARGSFIHIRQ